MGVRVRAQGGIFAGSTVQVDGGMSIGAAGAPNNVAVATNANVVLPGSGTVSGSVTYGTTATINSPSVTVTGGVTQAANAVNVAGTFSYLSAFATYVAGLPLNAQITRVQNQVTVSPGSGPAATTYVGTLDAAYVAQITYLTFAFPATNFVVIVVTGTAASVSNFAINLTGGITANNILWVFPDATSLCLTNIGLAGSIIAPNAAVQYNNGHIDGSIFAASLDGTVEVHNFPPVTPPCVILPPCPCSSVWTEPLPDFSAFVLHDISSSNSDCQGPLAAGGNVNLNSYSICSKCTPAYKNQSTLIAGGSVTLVNAVNYEGDIVYGTTFSGPSWSARDGRIVQQPNAYDFAGAIAHLQALAADWATQDPTDPVARVLYQVTLRQISDGPVALFSVPASLWNNIDYLNISVPADHFAVIIVPDGTDNTFQDFEVNLDGGIDESHVYFVFPTTTTLTITRVGVQGSVIAPNADGLFTNAHIEGSFFGLSINGDGEFETANPVPPPCICPPPPPPCPSN